MACLASVIRESLAACPDPTAVDCQWPTSPRRRRRPRGDAVAGGQCRQCLTPPTCARRHPAQHRLGAFLRSRHNATASRRRPLGTRDAVTLRCENPPCATRPLSGRRTADLRPPVASTSSSRTASRAHLEQADDLIARAAETSESSIDRLTQHRPRHRDVLIAQIHVPVAHLVVHRDLSDVRYVLAEAHAHLQGHPHPCRPWRRISSCRSASCSLSPSTASTPVAARWNHDNGERKIRPTGCRVCVASSWAMSASPRNRPSSAFSISVARLARAALVALVWACSRVASSAMILSAICARSRWSSETCASSSRRSSCVLSIITPPYTSERALARCTDRGRRRPRARRD